MKKEKRVFTPEHRESILKEAFREGKAETCRKYNLSPSLLRKWQHKYENSGLVGLSNRYKRVDYQAQQMELENERLNGTAHAAYRCQTGLRTGTGRPEP